MYGVMLNAKMEKFVNEPPVNASKKLKASPSAVQKFLDKCRIYPGVGSCDPSLTMTSITNV